jgi:hypothetical protein
MFPLPSWAVKAVAGVLLAAGLIGGAFLYRSHVYDDGYAAGVASAKQTQESALALARTTDKLISDKAEAGLRATMKDESNAHKARQASLEVALAAARADSVRLSADLARLHNDAVAGRSPSAAGTPASTGPQSDPAEGTGVSIVAGPSQFSLADLMRNDEANYTICRKNAARLTAVQDWYNAVRSGDESAQKRAIAEAPSE